MSARDVPRPDQVALPVTQVRDLEAAAMAALPPGTLMARAASALAVAGAHELRRWAGRVAGSRVVLLVGAGDNGGDGLYAGAALARRGARVDALMVAGRWHVRGAQALRAAGGRVHEVADPPEGADRPEVTDRRGVAGLIGSADLVVDALLGIGGHGGLREPAATLAALVRATGVPVLAVDLPSGVDADTGWVEGSAVHADRTVVLGVLKPGLLLGPGADHAGELTVAGIGLDLGGARELPGSVHVMTDLVAAQAIPCPGTLDDKYTRGVVGITAGSATYPGAAILCTGAARHGAAGLVRYVGPVAAEVVRAWPDVVASGGGPADAGRVQCWVAGPGRGTDEPARQAVLQALGNAAVVVLDADALTLLAAHEDLRTALARRTVPTLLTPHRGEFARLGGADPGRDRLGAVRALATRLRAVVLLKGAATVVADPTGTAYVAHSAPPELATAGSGDVLSGILGALLAHAQARCEQRGEQLTASRVAELAAAAAHLHGRAGALAASGGRAVAAADLLTALPTAVAGLRAASRPAAPPG